MTDEEAQEEQELLLEAMLQSMHDEPNGTRFLVIAITPDNGDIIQRTLGGFQIWELLGISQFLDNQFRLAANRLFLRQQSPTPPPPGDEEPRVM